MWTISSRASSHYKPYRALCSFCNAVHDKLPNDSPLGTLQCWMHAETPPLAPGPEQNTGIQGFR